MTYKKSEVMKIMMEHSQKIRQSIKDPSKETLAAWRWQDAKDELLLQIYEREEAAAAAAAAKDDDDTFDLTTEVKIK